jgi:hypothetical protein
MQVFKLADTNLLDMFMNVEYGKDIVKKTRLSHNFVFKTTNFIEDHE